MDEDLRTRLRALARDLRYDPEESGSAAGLKWVLQHRLEPGERAMLLEYIELGSTRALGQALDVSHTTAAKAIRRIRNKVLAEFDKIKDDEDIC